MTLGLATGWGLGEMLDFDEADLEAWLSTAARVQAHGRG